MRWGGVYIVKLSGTLTGRFLSRHQPKCCSSVPLFKLTKNLPDTRLKVQKDGARTELSRDIEHGERAASAQARLLHSWFLDRHQLLAEEQPVGYDRSRNCTAAASG